ncbi:hypothetical protein NliqN6_0470 [Naganishia liquefaciens]|uniref:Uncharacterized protein n=1 Tax=Naganishia liquefaciens TaxID=104408 RepID=A0A8H3YCD2_9TREE|nr:hypothetical protein NliqN6_0470 [Naganishia liquefaciens]
MPTQTSTSEVFSRIGGSLRQVKFNATIHSLVELLLEGSRLLVVEQLLDGSWFNNNPEIHDPLCRIDGFLDMLVSKIPSLQDFIFRVHHTVQDLAYAYGGIISSTRHALEYTARVSRANPEQPEVSVSSREFPADAQKAFRDLCYRTLAEENGIYTIEESLPAADLQDDFGADLLRFEREEDIEGWETEDEWL